MDVILSLSNCTSTRSKLTCCMSYKISLHFHLVYECKFLFLYLHPWILYLVYRTKATLAKFIFNWEAVCGLQNFWKVKYREIWTAPFYFQFLAHIYLQFITYALFTCINIYAVPLVPNLKIKTWQLHGDSIDWPSLCLLILPKNKMKKMNNATRETITGITQPLLLPPEIMTSQAFIHVEFFIGV